MLFASGLLSERWEMPAGKQSGTVGLHAGWDSYHPGRGYYGHWAQSQEGERNLKTLFQCRIRAQIFCSSLYRGAVIWLEPWRVSPNAFGNGDKYSLARESQRTTRAKDVVWCDTDSHEVVDVNDKGLIWEGRAKEREGWVGLGEGKWTIWFYSKPTVNDAFWRCDRYRTVFYLLCPVLRRSLWQICMLAVDCSATHVYTDFVESGWINTTEAAHYFSWIREGARATLRSRRHWWCW